MSQVCWDATTDGTFVIDVLVAGRPHRCLIDTGMYDPLREVGFDLIRLFYDDCLRAGGLTPLKPKYRRDASGHQMLVQCGIIQAQLFDPSTGSGVGPAVKLLASRTVSIPFSRVGVEFFHRLAGCRVDWNLTARRWCVEYP
jgi:hypothetical protein